MRFVSLFSGIGGFDLAFERAGMRCVAQVEINKHARSVLERHWPHVPRFDDVRTFGRQSIADEIDVVCGGFPCQDLSIAGKRRGFAGERSSLFFEMIRIADEYRPAYVVWENVPGLLTSAAGWDFAAVLSALDGIGYHGAWTVLDAQWFGVPQQRRRVFGVFSRFHSGAAGCTEILSLSHRMRRHLEARRQAGQEIAHTLGSGTAKGGRRTTDLDGHGAYIVGQAMSAKWAKGTSGPAGDEHHNLVYYSHQSRQDNIYGIGAPANALAASRTRTQQAYATQASVRRLTPLECERLQGFPDGWTDAQSDTARYVMLGNAVAVPVAEWIGKKLKQKMEEA